MSGTQSLALFSASSSYQVGGLKLYSLPHQLACGARETPVWAESSRVLREAECEAAGEAWGRDFPQTERRLSTVGLRSFTGTLEVAEQNLSSDIGTCGEIATHCAVMERIVFEPASSSFPVSSLPPSLLLFQWVWLSGISYHSLCPRSGKTSHLLFCHLTKTTN